MGTIFRSTNLTNYYDPDDLLPAKSSRVRFSVSTEPFFTSSPRAAKKSSTLPGSPNQPRWSAIRWRLLHPLQRATTTPFSYDSRQTVFTNRVSQTLQVKIMARSCLVDVFRLEKALYWTLLSSSTALVTLIELGINFESRWRDFESCSSSLTAVDDSVFVLALMVPFTNWEHAYPALE